MKLKDLNQIRESLIDFWDFTSNHLDGDETTLTNRMSTHYGKSLKIVEKEIKRVYLKNAKAKFKRSNLANPLN